jgi:hypothetical protein
MKINTTTHAARPTERHMQYELQIVNAKAAPATLLSVDVLSADNQSQLITTYDAVRVVDALRSTLPKPVTDAVIPTGQLRFLYLELSFDSAAVVPSGVVHRFNLLAAANPGTDQATPLQYVIAPVTFLRTLPLVLAAPLSGDGWVDFNGAFNNLTVHRGSVQTVNGQFFIAQRYAIDDMRLNGAGQIVNGDPADVTANVPGGSDILAVADSTVWRFWMSCPTSHPGSCRILPPSRWTPSTATTLFWTWAAGCTAFTPTCSAVRCWSSRVKRTAPAS